MKSEALLEQLRELFTNDEELNNLQKRVLEDLIVFGFVDPQTITDLHNYVLNKKIRITTDED